MSKERERIKEEERFLYDEKNVKKTVYMIE